MEEELDRFDAASDDGERFTVVEHGRVQKFYPLSGGVSESIGARRFALDDGRHVNPTQYPGAFKIVETDQIIWKI